jgi:hypothetical protein
VSLRLTNLPSEVPAYFYLNNVSWLDLSLDFSQFLRERAGLVKFHLRGQPAFDLSELTGSQGTLTELALDVGAISQTSNLEFPNMRRLTLEGDSKFSSPNLFNSTFRNTRNIHFIRFPLPYELLVQVLATSASKLTFKGYNEIGLKLSDERVKGFLAAAGVPSQKSSFFELETDDDCVWKLVDFDDMDRRNYPPSVEVETRNERDILMAVYTLSLMGVIGLGLLGNVLSGGVLSRRALRTSTTTIILLGLTLADTLVLTTFLFSVFFTASNSPFLSSNLK